MTAIRSRALRAFAVPAMLFCSLAAGAEAQDAALGFTSPSKEIEVSTALRDVVTEVHVREGDFVSRSDLLLVLDTAQLDADLAIARAKAAAAGPMVRAQAVLAAKQHQFDLLSRLRKQGAARAEEVAFAESELAVAKAELLAAEDQQRIAELEVARLEAALAQRYVQAPADGVITEIFRDAGELVGAQETRLMLLAVLDPLQVEVYVPTTLGRLLQPGLAVSVELPLAGLTLAGSIADVAVKADAASGTVRVRVQFDNGDLAVRSGERALVSFTSVATE